MRTRMPRVRSNTYLWRNERTRLRREERRERQRIRYKRIKFLLNRLRMRNC